MHYTEYVADLQKALPKQPHTLIPMQLESDKKRRPYLKSKAYIIRQATKNQKISATQIVEMISMLKNSMWQELKEFALLPMNRADYRHS